MTFSGQNTTKYKICIMLLCHFEFIWNCLTHSTVLIWSSPNFSHEIQLAKICFSYSKQFSCDMPRKLTLKMSVMPIKKSFIVNTVVLTKFGSDILRHAWQTTMSLKCIPCSAWQEVCMSVWPHTKAKFMPLFLHLLTLPHADYNVGQAKDL